MSGVLQQESSNHSSHEQPQQRPVHQVAHQQCADQDDGGCVGLQGALGVPLPLELVDAVGQLGKTAASWQ